MKPIIAECDRTWFVGKCQSCEDTRGWGCRFLPAFTNRLPQTGRERAHLFHIVYSYAEENGIVDCPHFNEARLSQMIDTAELLETLACDTY